MNITLSRWMARAGAPLLLILVLAACARATPATPGASAPTAAPTSVPAHAPAPTVAAPTAPATRLDTAALDAYVQQMMGIYDVPGSAIALIQDGQIVYHDSSRILQFATKAS